MQRELKVFNDGGSIPLGDFALSVIQNISQGYRANQRIGDHIRVKRVVVRLSITWGANQENSYSSNLRYIFLVDKRGLFSDITFFDALFDETITTTTPLECFNPDNVNRFDIVYDSFRTLKQEAQSSVYEPVWRYVPVVAPFDHSQVFAFDMDVVVSYPTFGSSLNNLVFVNTQWDPLTQLSGTSYTFTVYFEDYN